MSVGMESSSHDFDGAAVMVARMSASELVVLHSGRGCREKRRGRSVAYVFTNLSHHLCAEEIEKILGRQDFLGSGLDLGAPRIEIGCSAWSILQQDAFSHSQKHGALLAA